MKALAASFRRFLLPVLSGIAIGLAVAPAHSAGDVVDLDAKAVITKLAEGLTVGRTQLYTELERLGFGAEVAELKELTKSQLNVFSANTVLESLYRRAEVGVAGEGERFLAVLYKDAAPNSAALSEDPDFAAIRSRFSAEALDTATTPIRFAPVATVSSVASRPPLAPVVESAIAKLSYAYAGEGIAQIRSVVLRTFRKEGFDSRAFERALLDSDSQEGALRRMVAAGTPPPTTEAALHTLLMDAREGSAALSADVELLHIMEELSRELPPDLKRYADAEDRLDSRKAQMAEAGKLNQAGKVRKGGDADVLAALGALQDPGSDNGHPADRAPPPAPDNPNPADRAPPPAPDNPNPSNPGSGGGGGSPSPAEAQRAANSYDKYINETFELRPGQAEPALPRPSSTGPTASPRTSRSFTTARFSARAGRGVSVGATVKSEVSQKIEKAIWLPNEQDDRFGRMFVTYRNAPAAAPAVAVSRTLFADSFRAARTALWGTWTTADFLEGELLVLVSMDPDSPVSKKAAADAKKMLEAFQDAAVAKLDTAKKQRYAKLKSALKDARPPKETRESYEMEVDDILMEASDEVDEEAAAAFAKKFDKIKSQRGVVMHPACSVGSWRGHPYAWTSG